MERWKGRVALVTGATLGIGAGITRELVKHGLKVAACARNYQTLQDLQEELKTEPGEVLPIQCDLRKEDDILAMFKTIKDKYGGVDICINNAGVVRIAPVMTGETERWRNILEVNVLALLICTREALASMKDRSVDDGHIIHIGSTFGHQMDPRVPFHNVYAASKHMVIALAEGLRRELHEAKSNIRVSVISPGFTNTGIRDRLFVSDGIPKAAKESYTSKSRTAEMLEVEDVTSAVIYALAAPDHVQINEIIMRHQQMEW